MYLSQLQNLTLGDGTPSSLWEQMATINSRCLTPLPEPLLCQFFLPKLPTEIQIAVATVSPTAERKVFLATADRAYDHFRFQQEKGGNFTINTALQAPSTVPVASSVPETGVNTRRHSELNNLANINGCDLQNKPTDAQVFSVTVKDILEKLIMRVDNLEHAVKIQNRGIKPSSFDFDMCWYHAKFGENARQCRPPCKMAGNVKGGRS